MSDDDLGPSDFGQLPSSSTANDYYYSEEEVIDVEESITTLLASLQLERSRTRRPTESDDEQLRIVHQRLCQVITMETDDTSAYSIEMTRSEVKLLKKRKFQRIIVIYMNKDMSVSSNVSKIPLSRKRRLRRALPFSNCVREQIAILLGFVESLAEILVLELSIFGVPNKNEHRSIRKLIANALTNLTYGHAQSKRKLCFYPDFISTVVRVLNDAQNLAQVYAGLVRNLSWMSDGKMSDVLAPTARALARTAVLASDAGDDGCLRSALSALWNLASHSERNKRAICDEPGCLTMLTNILTSNARMTSLVRHDGVAMNQLNVLRNSAREDIRSAVKSVLNYLNQPTGYTRFNVEFNQTSQTSQITSVYGMDANAETHHAQAPINTNATTGDPDLSDSVLCTRSTSAQSLGSEVPLIFRLLKIAFIFRTHLVGRMPSASPGKSRHQHDSRNDNHLLADMIESAQPSPRKAQCSAMQSVCRDKCRIFII
uniref:Adenomatous polyposis coli protein n=1 Tax=Heterorhabditis bacteriophora TaxID=37862 RepID=A0A1I7W7M3_HETBA